MKRIDQICDGIYRIGEFWPEFGISVNQFLIVDDQPALIHTGTFPMFEGVRSAVGQIMDPKQLAYVVVPHFEADECGGMGRFVKDARKSTLLCSELGMALNLSGWDFNGPVKGMRDGTVIELGQKRLRFLETPHVHHWDSMMVFEETTRSLFPADLFIQPGEQPCVVREDLGKEMCQMYREVGIFAADKPVLDVVKRIEKLECNWVHPMHGGCLDSQTLKPFIRALREHPFAFDGKGFWTPAPDVITPFSRELARASQLNARASSRLHKSAAGAGAPAADVKSN